MSKAAPPGISIVLPVRNGERYLQQALESVFAQTYADFELVCVDDASSDTTPAILSDAARADARVRIMTNARRHGLPASLNLGFAKAKGALHTWVSHDNRMRPAMLERLVHCLAGDPGCGVAYSAYCEIDASGTVVGRHRARPSGELLLANVVGASFVYRAEVWQALGGYDESLQGVEDYDFWLRARHRFAMSALDEELLDYRLHSDSMTARHAAEIAALHDMILEREIPMEASGTKRAEAWLALMEQQLDPARLRYALKAALADPSTVMSRTRPALRWLRSALASSRSTA